MISSPIESVFQFCPRCGCQKPTARNSSANSSEASSSEASSLGDSGNPFRCLECRYTQFFGPSAAVGGLIINDADELLMVRRARDPGKGKFGLPGGFVDRGETVEQALAREVREETGLSLSSYEYLVSYPNLYDYNGVQAPVIDLFYLARAVTPAEIVLAEDELDSFSWCVPSEDQLGQMAFPSNRKAIELWISRRK